MAGVRKTGKAREGQSRVPYGPPIFDAIARGDIFEMKAVAEAARRALFGIEFKSVPKEEAAGIRTALDELERAIRRAETGENQNSGPMPPYGVPIAEAIARGDLQEMKAVASAARRALYNVDFKQPSGADVVETRKALETLEVAIRKLEGPK